MNWLRRIFSIEATAKPVEQDVSVKQAATIEQTVSLERAIEIFDQLADEKDIAFGYAKDGCYARAHIMVRRMHAMGLVPKKAWAFEGADGLRVKKPAGESVRWWYHVAAALPVKLPDGTVQDMVFDPGLFDGPVSLREWGEIMKAPGETLEIAAFGVPPKGHVGDYGPSESTSPATDNAAAETMTRYLSYQDAAPRTVFESQSRQQSCQMLAISQPSQGKTWRSPMAAGCAAGSRLVERLAFCPD